VIKLLVLFEVIQSTRETRFTEAACISLILPFFYTIVMDIVNHNKLFKEALLSRESEIDEMDKFIDLAAIVSRADAKGKITYVNEKFSQVSGYSLAEVLGKDHNIVNSGTHPKEFWADMYKTVIKDRQIWNKICINRAKDGSLYYVDTHIKGRFDHDGKLEGFMSIRQDITGNRKNEVEIRNRMTAINQSNAVIEFDLDGNVIFANKLFLETLGYSTESEIVGKHHRLFVEDAYSKSPEYTDFWETLRSGAFFSGEIIRVRKDGSLVHLRATYNPILNIDNKVYRIMKIATDITNLFNQQKEIEKKNTYLEHAAKIIRHDMHSGINTYIPRGISSLDRRMQGLDLAELKLEAPFKMIKEGLRHTQKVYKGVYEFTNLVKKDAVLNLQDCDLREILMDYLSATAYRDQVQIGDLGRAQVNEPLFCTSIDNLIRNGLKYNDSASKIVKISREGNSLLIEDNGRGLGREEFKALSKPYARKEGQRESGTGLGLNISIAIIEEHKFKIDCDVINSKDEVCGTKITIKLNED